MVKPRLIIWLGQTDRGTVIKDQNGDWLHGCVECGFEIRLPHDNRAITLGETYSIPKPITCPRCGARYSIEQGEVTIVQAGRRR